VNGSAGQAPAGHPDFNGILKSAQPPASQAPAASSSNWGYQAVRSAIRYQLADIRYQRSGTKIERTSCPSRARGTVFMLSIPQVCELRLLVANQEFAALLENLKTDYL